MGNKCRCRHLRALAFGVSLGVISGVCMMLFAWMNWLYGFGTPVLDLWASVYPGFEASLKGGFVGLAWGFLHGFVAGVIWAWIYNLCLCCSRCCCSCCKSTSDPSYVTPVPPLR